MKLGSVFHEVSSDEGSYTFRATDEWEATEIAPGGYHEAKEVIPEKVFQRNRGAFKRDATFRSWHEQTGECIWSGSIRDDLFSNDGRIDIALDGLSKLAERKTGRLLYQSRDYSEWGDDGTAGNTGQDLKWNVTVGDHVIRFFRYPTATADNFRDATGGRARFIAKGTNQLSRISFDAVLGDKAGADAAELSVRAGDDDNDWNVYGPTTLTYSGSTWVDVDLTQAGEPIPNNVQIRVGDRTTLQQTATRVQIHNLTVGGIASGEEFSVSAAVRDICTRLGVDDSSVDDYGFDVLPLDFKDGEDFAECLDYLSLLADARWLLLDTGTRPYLEFSRFGKRVWTAFECVPDLMPLVRYDQVTISYKLHSSDINEPIKKSERAKVLVTAEYPLDVHRHFGRVVLKDAVHNDTRPRAVGERLVEQLVTERPGGSVRLATVQDVDGRNQSAFLLHAGDTLRVPHRHTRGRVASKTMTNRGVTTNFENNYVALDRLLARRAKRMSA